MKTRSLVLLMAVAFVAAAFGCATPNVPSGDPMPEGRSYSGLWYSEQFEHMYLYQQGDRVEGVYAYSAGGTIEGELDGNLLLFDWHEPGDREQLRQEQSGKGYFRLVEREDGVELVGEWGSGDERTGSPWTAVFQREPLEDDPRTLEELREQH